MNNCPFKHFAKLGQTLVFTFANVIILTRNLLVITCIYSSIVVSHKCVCERVPERACMFSAGAESF